MSFRSVVWCQRISVSKKTNLEVGGGGGGEKHSG